MYVHNGEFYWEYTNMNEPYFKRDIERRIVEIT